MEVTFGKVNGKTMSFQGLLDGLLSIGKLTFLKLSLILTLATGNKVGTMVSVKFSMQMETLERVILRMILLLNQVRNKLRHTT